MSLNRRGLVLAGVMDRETGVIVTSLNDSREIANLHPSLLGRLGGRPLSEWYKGGSGVHGEIHGLNDLLWKREARNMSTAVDDSFGYDSIRLKGKAQGARIPACGFCKS